MSTDSRSSSAHSLTRTQGASPVVGRYVTSGAPAPLAGSFTGSLAVDSDASGSYISTWAARGPDALGSYISA